MNKDYVVYLTTYLGDKLPKYYIGSTSNRKILSGKYFGTVTSKRYGKIFNYELKNNKHLFSVEILSYHKTRKEALSEELRLQKQKNVINSNDYINESYASINGCFGRNVSGKNNPMFNRTNEVVAIDEKGNKIRVSKEEFDNNDKLSGHTSGYVYVIDLTNGKLVKISRNEFRNNKNKYKHPYTGTKASLETKKILSLQRKNTLIVKDWEGNKFRVDKNDERIKLDILGNHNALRYIITDTNGNVYKTMNIFEFFKKRNIKIYRRFKQTNGEIIVNHNPSEGNSLNGWKIECLDKKRKYKRNEKS